MNLPVVHENRLNRILITKNYKGSDSDRRERQRQCSAQSAAMSTNRELAEYEEFALRALADLLESAERRSSELQGEVDWLREYIGHQNFELGQLRPEVDRLRAEVDRLQIYVARLEQERVVIHAELDFLRDYRPKSTGC
jgi:chromosome segregation ATPase